METGIYNFKDKSDPIEQVNFLPDTVFAGYREDLNNDTDFTTYFNKIYRTGLAWKFPIADTLCSNR